MSKNIFVYNINIKCKTMKVVNTKYQFQISRLNNAKAVKCINDYIINRILYTNIV